jgi:hypothetical protein
MSYSPFCSLRGLNRKRAFDGGPSGLKASVKPPLQNPAANGFECSFRFAAGRPAREGLLSPRALTA